MRASAARVAAALAFALLMPLGGQAGQTPAGGRGFQQRPPDFERQLQRQVETDKTWRAASDGFMQMETITYHTSDRRVDPKTLDWNLDPFHAVAPTSNR